MVTENIGEPTAAITIGSYGMPDFVRLCIRATRREFGDHVPILVSDDASESSGMVEDICRDEEVRFITSDARRSHCSGDWQVFLAGGTWAGKCGSRIAIKLSQRFIPLAGLAKLILDPFKDPNVDVVYSPMMDPRNAVRPSVRFYSKFNVLTDCLAWRVDAISPQELMDHYRSRVLGASHSNSGLVEFAWDDLIKNRFAGRAVAVDELANPVPMEEKKYLRKASALDAEYRRVAEELGVDGRFDTREWFAIEGHNYMRTPQIV